MNGLLRVSLIACSLLILFFVMRRIRKAGLEISDSIFWMGLSAVLILVAVVPQVAYWASDLLGFDSASNFVFFCGIIVLLVRTFAQDQKITALKKKLAALVQAEALAGQDDE